MLYQTIIEYFRENIEKGAILPGEKLPSLRKIADQFDVSLSTAVEAYRKLELYGYVIARDRSGYLARLPSSGENILKPSKKFISKVSQIEHIDEIIELVHQSLDKQTAPFGLGTPAPEKFPHQMLNRAFQHVLKQQKQMGGEYLFGMGLEDLRVRLARWMRPWIGVTSKDNILITNGCLEALNLALSAECEVGDLIAIESPCYFGILHAIHHHGLKALEVSTHPEEGLDPVALESLAKQNKIKVLISTANAQNPLGFTMSDDRKRAILAVCKKYKIRLIEDDLYGEISFQGVRPKSYKYFDRDNIVTYCASVSKFLGPGMRIGWCIPAQEADHYLRQKLSLNLTTNSYMQYVLNRILAHEDLNHLGSQLANYYQHNIQVYANVLRSQLGDRLGISQPTGSYFLWVRMDGVDTVEAYQRAKKQKLSFTPGPLFSATRQYRSYLRINCAHEFHEKRNHELMSLCRLLKD